MDKKEVQEYNERIIQEISNKVKEYSKDEIGAFLCQDLLIRCLMEFKRLDDIGGDI